MSKKKENSSCKYLEKSNRNKRQILEQFNPEDILNRNVLNYYYYFSHKYDAMGIANIFLISM